MIVKVSSCSAFDEMSLKPGMDWLMTVVANHILKVMRNSVKVKNWTRNTLITVLTQVRKM